MQFLANLLNILAFKNLNEKYNFDLVYNIIVNNIIYF